MDRFCIIANKEKEAAGRLSMEMQKYIMQRGGTCHILTGQEEALPEQAQCLFVLGGDGTLIRAAALACRQEVPMIGVNLGHLGYLCELEEGNVYPAIDQIMTDHYIMEERMMLSGYQAAGGQQEYTHRRALNDIVIFRKGPLQLVELTVSVNGEYLNTFRADGIIVATPTGSTGYSMSAGGPIIDPKARMLLITPINAHNLNSKSIVLSPEDEVTIELKSRQSQKNERAEVNFDGEWVFELGVGDSITIRASRQRTRILKLSRLSFLETLRKKMEMCQA